LYFSLIFFFFTQLYFHKDLFSFQLALTFQGGRLHAKLVLFSMEGGQLVAGSVFLVFIHRYKTYLSSKLFVCRNANSSHITIYQYYTLVSFQHTSSTTPRNCVFSKGGCPTDPQYFKVHRHYVLDEYSAYPYLKIAIFSQVLSMTRWQLLLTPRLPTGAEHSSLF